MSANSVQLFGQLQLSYIQREQNILIYILFSLHMSEELYYIDQLKCPKQPGRGIKTIRILKKKIYFLVYVTPGVQPFGHININSYKYIHVYEGRAILYRLVNVFITRMKRNLSIKRFNQGNMEIFSNLICSQGSKSCSL